MNAGVERLRAWAEPRMPVLVAVLQFAVGSVILASGLRELVSLGPGGLATDDPLRLLPFAVLCATELLRTRAPGVGLSAALVLAGAELFYDVAVPTLLVVMDLLFAAVVYGKRRTSRFVVWCAGAVVLVFAVLSIVSAHDFQEIVVRVVQVCSIPLIPVWWGVNVRQHRDAAAAERARADQVARIADLDRDAAVREERARMARDLHDVIAGHLSAIAIQSAAALSMVDGDTAAMRRVLKSVRENSVQSLTEMRAMIHLLRSEKSGVEHTAPARLRDIAQLLESARVAGLSVSASADLDAELPVAVDLSAYRIVQEALANAVKHAPGSRASVTVDRQDATLVVEVVNDRTVSTVESSGGRGLLHMRERAEAVGGVLEAGPHERQWRVRAELPAEETL
ncbi:sensor histidine kinase [Actinophytocola sp. NPDC049390]|uniref:sensor histidine kinase n=1 Tax=Actinophytocola sp. NPDC049390 TaxID=3363894 RepID=UPI0037A10988